MTYANLFRICAALLIGCVGLLADDLGLGTWKVDNSKSTVNGQPAKDVGTATFSQSGDEITRVEDRVTPDGKRITARWTGKLDGKDYPYLGSTGGSSIKGVTMSMKRTGTNATEATVKRDGKVINTVTRTVSADGKSAHTIMKHTPTDGQPYISDFYLIKQ